MKAAYVRPGGPQFPDQDKARRLGVDSFIWDATDPAPPLGLAGVLGGMRGAGWKVGITRDPVWENYRKAPEGFARQCSDDLTRLGRDGEQCFMVMDIERHDAAYVGEAIAEFKRVRPGRFLYWTMEPLQFAPSWVTDGLVTYLRALPNFWLVPQLYRGGMEPVSERACVDEIAARGISRGRILSYYGRFEERFNGVLFDFANIAG